MSLRKPTAVLLALFWVIFPIITPLHFAFAEHKHVFCQEHQQYEEIEVTSKVPDTNYKNQPFTTTPHIDPKTTADTINPHIGCPFASLYLCQPATFAGKTFISFPAKDIYQSIGSEVFAYHAISTLQVAPKNSPPLSTVAA